MRALVGVIGLSLIFVVLWDAFETIILPRRVARKFRLTRFFYRFTWRPWSAMMRRVRNAKRRELYLGFYGPLSLLLLLTMWAVGLVFSFALLHWAAGSPAHVLDGLAGFRRDLYLSGTTLFTLGIGDVIPGNPWARALTVIEAGVGFGFLAVVIGYLPVVYQAFSRREVNISLLDARAGTPPTAVELLRRHSSDHGLEALQQLLRDWERWSAELMESHLSYPALAYFRSQHNNQSWLGALTAILDTSALVMAGVEGACARQAELTFAIARHAVVDLAQVFGTPPVRKEMDRLPPEEVARIREHLASAGLRLREEETVVHRLKDVRRTYEPYVQSLSRYLSIALPPWYIESRRKDNWQTSAWDKSVALRSPGTNEPVEDDHF
jgi:Ion channel